MSNPEFKAFYVRIVPAAMRYPAQHAPLRVAQERGRGGCQYSSPRMAGSWPSISAGAALSRRARTATAREIVQPSSGPAVRRGPTAAARSQWNQRVRGKSVRQQRCFRGLTASGECRPSPSCRGQLQSPRLRINGPPDGEAYPVTSVNHWSTHSIAARIPCECRIASLQ
jgi:hypothetical protein